MSKKTAISDAKMILCITAVFALAISFAGCFSPWTGNEGSVTISLGGRDEVGRWVINYQEHEEDSFEHEIILKGPGGTIIRTLHGTGTVSIQLSPGTWQLVVRAMGDRTFSDTSLVQTFNKNRLLRAIGFDNAVNVTSGGNTTVPIQMHPAIEVTNFDQLKKASAYGEFIVIANDIVIEETLHFDSETYNIITDRHVRLTRANLFGGVVPCFLDSFFSVKSGSAMNLGNPRMVGSITLDGGNDYDIPSANESLIYMEYSKLNMYDGVTLMNNSNGGTCGGAITVDEAGTFVMYGGTISGNYADGGGAVFVNGGSFEMHGGTIGGSSLDDINESSGGGGGVLVFNAGEFYMYGGTISGNVDYNSSNGGGVCVEGQFYMSGGSIVNNETNGSGGGVYVDTQSEFTMIGGTIKGNSAVYGGGVYVENDVTSKFYMNGGSIGGNTADIRGGGVYIGGIYGVFEKNIGGIIYGENEGVNTNFAKNNSVFTGHAAFFASGGTGFWQNKTLGINAQLRTSDTSSWEFP